MREISFSEATLEAMSEEMERDSSVFVLGEDIARQGGIFGQFKGLPQKFGTDRVLDTPISETAIVGAAVGAALAGMRPVADMHFADFIGVCMDVRRPVQSPHGAAGAGRHHSLGGGATLTKRRSLVHAYSRFESRYPFESG